MNAKQLNQLDSILNELGEFNEDMRGFYMVDDRLNMHNTLCNFRTELIELLEIVNDAENNMAH